MCCVYVSSALCTIRRLFLVARPGLYSTVAITDVAGRSNRGQLLPCLPRRPDLEAQQKVKVVQILHRVGWVAPLTHTKSVSKVSFQWHTEGHDQWRPGAGPKFNTDHTYFTVYSQPDMFDCTLSQYTDKDKPRVLPVYTLHTPHAGARKTR